MGTLVWPALTGLFFLLGSSMAKDSPPRVQVYSQEPGHFGKPNFLICHVSDFHPPEIRIEILRDNVEMKDGNQTDLAFNEDWHYHLTKHVPFTPNKGNNFACRVTHIGKTNTYHWEADM